MKILIIHGWMHSSKIYKRLKEDLSTNAKYDVTLYELPGFGDNPAKYKENITVSYSKDLRQYLIDNKYDVVIAHSLGGNVTLRATEDLSIRRILLSPEYKGITLLKLVMPFTLIGVPVLNILKHVNPFTTFILKLFSLLTINSWKAITNEVIESARKADSHVAVELLKEMSDDTYKTTKSSKTTYLILGENDRIISKTKMKALYDDLEQCEMFIINKIGHTAVLENYNELYARIYNICEEIKNESGE